MTIYFVVYYTAVNLYIDVPAAQTGLTRYTEINPKWSVAKIDSYDTLRVDLRSFPPIRVTTKPKILIFIRNLYVKAS